MQIPQWQFWWLCSILIWWGVLWVFRWYLSHFDVPAFHATIGAMLPLFTYAALLSFFTVFDHLLFLTTVMCFVVVQKREKKYLPILTALILLTFTLVPLISPVRGFVIRDFLNMAKSIHVFSVLAVSGAVKITRAQALNFAFIPCYVVVALLAVDWYRWIVMAAPIWVPLVLNNWQEGKR